MVHLQVPPHLFVNGDRKLIWNSNIPNKVKFFVWRAFRDILPTRHKLQSRGIRVTPFCPLCNRNVENVWHALVDCPTVRPIWQEAGFWNVIDEKSNIVNSFHELTFGFLNENTGLLGERFLMILWSIWYRRNDILWNNGPREASLVVRRANQIFSDWKASKKVPLVVNDPLMRPNRTAWSPPRRGFLKCNVDAATFQQYPKAGLGSVLRNCNGDFIAAKASPIGSFPPVRECEALAILDALKWISSREDRNVIFESDAKVVVDAIYDDTSDHSEFGDIIKDIRRILNAKNHFSVHYISRQANEMAHLTARHSCSLARPFIFHVMPLFLNYCNCNNSVCRNANETNESRLGNGIAEAR